jgi:5'(3')-deoxyribonucleotidase
MRPRVLLDCDGVLADFVGGYLGLLDVTLGIKATYEQITRFDIGASLGLTKEQSSQMKRAVGSCEQFARCLAVCPGAVFGVRAIEEIADVYIVTSPFGSNPTWTHDREHWLKSNFDIPSKRVVHTAAKYLVRGDILVDDKTEALHPWMKENPGRLGPAVQWETPHNRNDDWLGVSTNNWSELREIVERAATVLP